MVLLEQGMTYKRASVVPNQGQKIRLPPGNDNSHGCSREICGVGSVADEVSGSLVEDRTERCDKTYQTMQMVQTFHENNVPSAILCISLCMIFR
jgi:hypothetical protein